MTDPAQFREKVADLSVDMTLADIEESLGRKLNEQEAVEVEALLSQLREAKEKLVSDWLAATEHLRRTVS